METIITMRGLRKSFGEKCVLKDIDLSIERGEIFGLLGPSGAGKTTMVNILTGQLAYDGGQVQVLGKDLAQAKDDICDHAGIMMDHFGLYERLSAYDNLKIFAGVYGLPMSRVDDILKKTGLYEARKEAASNLSKGMKGRLKLARALLRDVDLLFLDEPTTGLDPSTAKAIHELLLEKCAQGATIFLTTHNMVEAQTICGHVALLDHGCIVEYGRPDEICRKYNHLNKIRLRLVGGECRELPNSPAAAQTISQLLEEGQLSTIHSSEPDLEQVFLELTGRSLESA